MKKILSTLLVVAMLLSLALVAVVPTAAADDEAGFWSVYGRASHHDEDYEGDKTSVPGYEYTDDGFHMTSADWSSTNPWGQLQTTEKVYIKDGVYMQVRVDNFPYVAATDKWFNFNIWNQPMIDEGSPDPKYGHGVQTIMRPGTGTETEPGKVTSIQWAIEEFKNAGTVSFPADKLSIVDGKNIFTLEIKWEDDSYAVSINGIAAPKDVIDYMNEEFAEGEAHIGFAMHSTMMGGTMDATVLKWGTSEANATTPEGDDKKDPENYYIEYAEAADPSAVAEGMPAILMTGDREGSDLKMKPVTATGAIISITEDERVHVAASKSTSDAGIWRVDNEKTYNIEDFPIVLCITKNFCACGMDGECMAFEEAHVYMCVGDDTAPSDTNKLKNIDVCEESYQIGDDNYIYFFQDVLADKPNYTGRINACRFDFVDIDLSTPGANEFDIELIAFFRTEEEAEAYAEKHLTSLGWTDESDEDDNDAPADDETETSAGNETEAPATNETEAPATNNNANNTNNDAATNEGESSGCGSVVGFGAIAVVATAAVAGFVTFKKKED